MRISSLILSTQALTGIHREQAAIARLTQHIATGQAITAPKDDPVRAPRILELTDRIALRQQYLANQDKARLALNYEQTVIGQMRKVLEHARSVLMGVAPSHDANLRAQYSDLIMADYNQLKGLANTRDPSGNYIFSGHQTATAPYTHTQVAPGNGNPADHESSGSTTYHGTALPGGLRYIEIDTGRLVQVNDNLDSVFRDGIDLLQALDQVAIDLRENPDPTLLTQSDIDTAISVINTALDRLGLIERRIAAAQLEVADTLATTKTLLNEEKNALGALIELDQAAAIVELQRRQITLEAAQRAYARTSGLSLFNFL